MTGLKRALNPMPDDVRAALTERGLMTVYEARPDDQKNDYLGWIGRAKRPDTWRKQLDQMLDELQRGGVYRNMAWRG
ncbi:YdeI/OmpD-associated family protein [Mesorhizobium newzealandense]|uniref:YdeI/OmpD-associated family protein n=1 Tax=Mesorhizobium newzealandense TaxID=1300302 RepID=A0ABW4UF17_9HYPH